jgi:glycogen debranching enzyme
LAEVLDKLGDADLYIAQAKKITGGMRKLMLEESIFWSVYLDPEKDKYQKIKVNTWAIFAPLFAKIATKEEADFIVKKYLLSNQQYNLKFILPTVSKSDPSFDPEGFWRGPVWLSVNWFIFKGLKRYGYNDLAERIKNDSIALIEKSGFREYYNPLTGEGLGAKNFTWGGLVLDMI